MTLLMKAFEVLEPQNGDSEKARRVNPVDLVAKRYDVQVLRYSLQA